MIRRTRSGWQAAILICRKCTKKAGVKPLAKALRRHTGLKKGRKAAAGIVEIGCLGICPKAGITIIDSRRPGEWLIFPADAAVASVAAALRLGPHGAVRPYSPSNSSGNGSLPEIRRASASPSASE